MAKECEATANESTILPHGVSPMAKKDVPF